jgi:hypothetical protein
VRNWNVGASPKTKAVASDPTSAKANAGKNKSGILDPREALRANRQESSKNGQTDGDSGDAAHKGQHNGFD